MKQPILKSGNENAKLPPTSKKHVPDFCYLFSLMTTLPLTGTGQSKAFLSTSQLLQYTVNKLPPWGINAILVGLLK